jgi:hypothetical protein
MINTGNGSSANKAWSDFYGKPTYHAQTPQVEVICANGGDNAAALDLLKRLRTLRSDSDSHGELLATLCVPVNREKLKTGDAAALADLFSYIDVCDEAHRQRLASIDGVFESDEPAVRGEAGGGTGPPHDSRAAVMLAKAER